MNHALLQMNYLLSTVFHDMFIVCDLEYFVCFEKWKAVVHDLEFFDCFGKWKTVLYDLEYFVCFGKWKILDHDLECVFVCV